MRSRRHHGRSVPHVVRLPAGRSPARRGSEIEERPMQLNLRQSSCEPQLSLLQLSTPYMPCHLKAAELGAAGTAGQLEAPAELARFPRLKPLPSQNMASTAMDRFCTTNGHERHTIHPPGTLNASLGAVPAVQRPASCRTPTDRVDTTLPNARGRQTYSPRLPARRRFSSSNPPPMATRQAGSAENLWPRVPRGWFLREADGGGLLRIGP